MRTTFIDRTVMRPFVSLIPRYVRPNFITALRLISVPFVAWLLLDASYKAGFVLFAVSAFSDALDGALARTRGEVTPLGKLFDPIADKLLIIATAFVVLEQFLPLWLFYAILAVELLTITLALYAKYVRKADVEANLFGKIKMVLETLGVLLLLIYAAFWPISGLLLVSFWLLLFSVFFAVVSLLYNKSI